MLTFLGGQSRLCDGVARRSFLKVGGLTFGAASLSLADVYRAEAAAKADPILGRPPSAERSSLR